MYQKRRVIYLLLIILVLASCVSGQKVPLTQDEQNRIDVQSYEQAFMTLYSSARNYILANPQYTQQWNTVIQPAFSQAHQALILYERNLLDKQMTPAEVQNFINNTTYNLTNMLLAIGWVK